MKKSSKPLKVLPVPVPNIDHPDPPHEALMRHEFTVGLIAPKGAGKTTMMINWLQFYKGYFHNIYIFSPTVKSDDKWKWVKAQKGLIAQNFALINWIEKKKQERDGQLISKIVADPPVNLNFDDVISNEKEVFDGKIPEENFYYNYTHQDLTEILDKKMDMINVLEAHDEPKFLADRDLFIFDDLVGSTLFSMAQDNQFKGFNTRHRHFSASVLMVAQGYKEIPKTIRTNWTGLILFEIFNQREKDVIYEEYPMGLTREVWNEVFNHVTSEPHGFLYFDSKKEKGKRIMGNFDYYINKCQENEGILVDE